MHEASAPDQIYLPQPKLLPFLSKILPCESGVVVNQGTQVIQNQNLVISRNDPAPRFFKASSYEEQKNINRGRVSGTCQWFLDGPTFQDWKHDNQVYLLWLSAYPGCGKSVLSKALIDERLVDDGSATICYFFFKDNGEQDHAAAAICALLHQLFVNREDLFQKHARKAVDQHGDHLRADFDVLWRLLLSAVSDPSAGKVICILDALDECREPDRGRLIQELERFYIKPQEKSMTGSQTKFLVTSRPYVDIERRFAKLINRFGNTRLGGIHISGEDNLRAISLEINMVMNAEVDHIASENGLSDEIRQVLKSRFSEIKNTTYLWLDLTLKIVRVNLGLTKKKLLKRIDELPQDLEEAYEKILERCSERNEQEGKRLLNIIVAAQRPLTLSEIDVALEVEAESTSCFDLDLETPNKREIWIRDACGLFVKIIDSRVHLIHQTAREFLLRQEGKTAIQGKWQHSIDLQTAHSILAKLCIVYLLLREFRRDYKSRHEDSRPEHGLLLYAANYWIPHTQQAGLIEPVWTTKIASLCDVDEGSSSFWLGYHSDRLLWVKSMQEKQPPIFWAARWGLVHMVASFLNDHQMEATEDLIKIAISNRENGEAILNLLLERTGARSQITEEVFEAAAANQRNAGNMMKSLLAIGSPSQITEDVFRAAIRNTQSGQEVLGILLDLSAVDVTISGTIIMAAAQNNENRIAMLEMLLHKPSVKITVGGMMAAASSYPAGKVMMKLLLERRRINIKISNLLAKIAIKNPGCGDGVLKVLLDHFGADISVTPEMIHSVVANEQNGLAMLNVLLEERGPDVKVTDVAVNIAISNRRLGSPMVELLVKHKGSGIITDDMIYAVVYGRETGSETGTALLNVLLTHRHDFKITDEMILEALINKRIGATVLKVLLGKMEAPFCITDRVIQAVSEDPYCFDMKPPQVNSALWAPYDLLDVLLQQEGVRILMTEEIIRLGCVHDFIEIGVDKILTEKREKVHVTKKMTDMAFGNDVLEKGLKGVGPIRKDTKQPSESSTLPVNLLEVEGMGNVRIPDSIEPQHSGSSAQSQHLEGCEGLIGFGGFEDSERFEYFEDSEGSGDFEDFEDSDDPEDSE
ncbi:uncharacterized protein N7503_001069 [Penicillium pulvis]|uniref:uncharacterized protein n=1 Tax=Penicillium pulvis TaxID=1562058 RepID=UPI002548E518|nr:uncharacterized protein N7503_001069 [Penicillium pulvis]KAJ5814319.1 hypothetical protein N7503_001069 [Penicillium pulvis]